MNNKLTLLPTVFAVAKYDDIKSIDIAVYTSDVYAIASSDEEVSVICDVALPKHAVAVDAGWRLLRYTGSLDDHAIGVVASIAGPLAVAGISVIVHTTYEHGYFGVKADDLRRALEILDIDGGML